jgi:hypothetical protein
MFSGLWKLEDEFNCGWWEIAMHEVQGLDIRDPCGVRPHWADSIVPVFKSDDRTGYVGLRVDTRLIDVRAGTRSRRGTGLDHRTAKSTDGRQSCEVHGGIDVDPIFYVPVPWFDYI